MSMQTQQTSRFAAGVLGLVTATCCMLSMSIHAQDSPVKPPDATNSVAIDLGVYEGPSVKKDFVPPYPLKEVNTEVEGWVTVGFMIGPTGKPYELTVIDASGNIKAFKESALNAASRWTFVPAMQNGEPVDSGAARKVTFLLNERSTGANSAFVSAYKKFGDAVKANDKAAADAAMEKMTVKNLYEDAYYGIVQFNYARLWGNEDEQRAGLRRAIASEEKPVYLPKDLFISTLINLFRLEVSSQDFAGALQTAHIMKSAGASKDVLAAVTPVVEKIETLKKDNRSFKVTGTMVGGSWNQQLLKKRFQITVQSGHISEIKLRCDAKYVFFRFDPTIDYKVGDKYGACQMELLGDAETKFELTQM